MSDGLLDLSLPVVDFLSLSNVSARDASLGSPRGGRCGIQLRSMEMHRLGNNRMRIPTRKQVPACPT